MSADIGAFKKAGKISWGYVLGHLKDCIETGGAEWIQPASLNVPGALIGDVLKIIAKRRRIEYFSLLGRVIPSIFPVFSRLWSI
ncbi:MAG: hypothetical protein P4L42_12360 [Desulfocapsaceae bacterium]|nr:hypothetical protein [Desulfocapsaceae bacterium]